VWADTQERVIFTNWGVGEPNNCCGGENCMQMRADGLWNDSMCSNLYETVLCELQFVC
jgi:hypothetical protein